MCYALRRAVLGSRLAELRKRTVEELAARKVRGGTVNMVVLVSAGRLMARLGQLAPGLMRCQLAARTVQYYKKLRTRPVMPVKRIRGPIHHTGCSSWRQW